ncbi:MAG: BrnT family toxin [Halothiobacillus sp.]|nr:BrnT family toxin [Halothiobacillus sp.]
MKQINWSPDKNQQLIEERGLCFEDIVFALQQGKLLDDMRHPNTAKYPNQRLFVVDLDGYIHLVPYVENEHEIFLKTIIPSRKATKQYLGTAHEKQNRLHPSE